MFPFLGCVQQTRFAVARFQLKTEVERPVSALGQKQTCAVQKVMSAKCQ